MVAPQGGTAKTGAGLVFGSLKDLSRKGLGSEEHWRQRSRMTAGAPASGVGGRAWLTASSWRGSAGRCCPPRD